MKILSLMAAVSRRVLALCHFRRDLRRRRQCQLRRSIIQLYRRITRHHRRHLGRHHLRALCYHLPVRTRCRQHFKQHMGCLLYTSDAADE